MKENQVVTDDFTELQSGVTKRPRITLEKREKIIEMSISGHKQTDIAAFLGVSQASVSRVIKGYLPVTTQESGH